MTLISLINKKGNAQYNSPYESKDIDFKIIKNGNNFISADSFYNKIVTRVDTIDLEKNIKEGYFTRLYSKLFVILQVDSVGKMHFVDVAGNSMEYSSKPIKNVFLNGNVEFRKDLLDDSKNRYIIQPLVIFSSDKKTGAFSTHSNQLVKSPYVDSLKVGSFFWALSVMTLPDYFISSPIQKRGWLSAVWLPTVYINKGANKNFWGAWYKELE